MKTILLALVVTVCFIMVTNFLVFKDVPESIRRQQISEIERHMMPVRSISMDDRASDDLAVLGPILEGNRVVMLGESTHQDGETFKAKSRLVRYLHEHHGYNVVLYEAGQYDMWIMNQAMRSGETDLRNDSIAGLGLFNFWWQNEEVKPLSQYYLQTMRTSTPIELGGFDFQFSGSLLRDSRATLLIDFLKENGIELESYPLLKKYVNDLHRLAFRVVADRTLKAKKKLGLLNELRGLESATSKLKASEERSMYQRYFRDIRHNLEKSWKYETGSWASMHFRDSLMAQNLIYQIDSLYAGQKVIVWCSNIHTFSSRYNEDYRPLGAYIKGKYGRASYMLNFTSYARRNAQGRVVERPGKLAIENAFHRINVPYFLLDLTSAPANSLLGGSFVSTINQGVDQERKWSEFIDGIFYIDINGNPTYSEQ